MNAGWSINAGYPAGGAHTVLEQAAAGHAGVAKPGNSATCTSRPDYPEHPRSKNGNPEMTDIITQVEQVIIDHTSDDVSYGELAQALADAGLLAEPARTVPNRAAIAQALYINHRDAIGDNATAIDLAEKGADAVLELLAGKPTVAEAKAEAWDEGARAGLDKGLDIAELVHLGGGKLNIPDVPPPPTNPYRAQDGK